MVVFLLPVPLPLLSSLLEAVSLAHTPASSPLSVLRVRVFPLAFSGVTNNRAGGAPRLYVETSLARGPGFRPAILHTSSECRIHCSIHARLGLQQTRASGPLVHCRHHMTCLNKCCVYHQIWCLISALCLQFVLSVLPPSPFLSSGPGGCLAGAHAGEQSSLCVACACVSSRFTTSTEQPAFTAVFTHGFAADTRTWPTGAFQAPMTFLSKCCVSSNLVFDQCSVFAVFPLCPPSLSSPLFWTWRLSRWRTRRRAVLSLCCVCVCFLPVHHVHRATRIHCSFHAWVCSRHAHVAHWRISGTHDMFEQMLRISPNLVFDQCAVFSTVCVPVI